MKKTRLTQSTSLAKIGWEKRFDEMWFVPHDQTTLMNWEGLIKDTRSWFGEGHSAAENEAFLKNELARIIKDFIKKEMIKKR